MNELVRWDPFKAIAPLESLLDIPSLVGPARAAAFSGPRIDVAENDHAYQLAVELPGVKKEAIQVSVYDNNVTISADVAAPGEEGTQWLLRERGYGYSDGVLTLTLKKKSASQQERLAIH